MKSFTTKCPVCLGHGSVMVGVPFPKRKFSQQEAEFMAGFGQFITTSRSYECPICNGAGELALVYEGNYYTFTQCTMDFLNSMAKVLNFDIRELLLSDSPGTLSVKGVKILAKCFEKIKMYNPEKDLDLSGASVYPVVWAYDDKMECVIFYQQKEKKSLKI